MTRRGLFGMSLGLLGINIIPIPVLGNKYTIAQYSDFVTVKDLYIEERLDYHYRTCLQRGYIKRED